MTTPRRRASRTVSLLLAAVVALVGAPHSFAGARCPDIDAVAVPGTTETDPGADPRRPVGILGRILEPLTRHTHRAVETFYTPYPATIVGGTGRGGYLGSKSAGIHSTNAHLKEMAQRCPRTWFLLTGYSQGADIAGDIAAAIGHHRGVIPAERVIGVGLVADPSQSPVDQPTIGLGRPGMGFAGVRSGGFGALGERGAVLTVCAPRDYYCNLPQTDLVMRLIGHLGAHLDFTDAADSAQKLANMFMAGLLAPAVAATQHILQLIRDPQLLPNLLRRGIAFAQSLTQQLFWLAGPQVAAIASDVLGAANTAIGLIRSHAWTAVPAVIATLAAKAAAADAGLSHMQTTTSTLDVSHFAAVGIQFAQGEPRAGDLITAILNAINTATGGIGAHATNLFGPTFTVFSVDTVATALIHFAEFIHGNFHCNYDATALDSAGHTGTQLIARFLTNQISMSA